jgi:hypothetical protein
MSTPSSSTLIVFLDGAAYYSTNNVKKFIALRRCSANKPHASFNSLLERPTRLERMQWFGPNSSTKALSMEHWTPSSVPFRTGGQYSLTPMTWAMLRLPLAVQSSSVSDTSAIPLFNISLPTEPSRIVAYTLEAPIIPLRML